MTAAKTPKRQKRQDWGKYIILLSEFLGERSAHDYPSLTARCRKVSLVVKIHLPEKLTGH